MPMRPTPTPTDADPAAPARLALQRLAFPDPAITTERDLFVHLDGTVQLGMEAGNIGFGDGGTAWFTTYMNLFNLRLWHSRCQLDGLWLRLEGRGRFGLRIWQITGSSLASEVLCEEMIELSEAGVEIDLSAALSGRGGVIMFRLISFGEGQLTGGAWLTAAPAQAGDPIRLAISITTFRREDEVATTAARIGAFVEGAGAAALAELGAEVHLFVVDNGQSADLAPHPALTVIPNANLGGAGGFARGLAAASDGDFTHCLFMDDDASFMMESLLRTLAFLRLAKSPRAAVSGAMISEARTWAMWENGAQFNGACRPRHVGVDLRDWVQLSHMELEAAGPTPPEFYAGWWYFAFPIAAVKHFPFPFFVRGDDISFSLANDFDTSTLAGVVSFQEDFSTKESPLTLYLDLRNHLHHHMVQDGLERSALGTARIVVRFLARSIIRMHYDSAEAQLMAWDDVMKGPEFFAQNADMMEKRPQVTALIRSEAWGEPEPGEATDLPDIPEQQAMGLRAARMLKWTLNGHLIPFWSLLAGRRRTVPMAQRGLIWPLWGQAEVRFTDPVRGKAYTVQHSKRRFAGLMWRASKQLIRWIRVYPELSRAYRAAYPDMANRGFWQTRFLNADAAEGADDRAAE